MATFGGELELKQLQELHGDIDDFLIGNWLSTTTAGQNVRTSEVTPFFRTRKRKI
jgi:hypothetical protein